MDNDDHGRPEQPGPLGLLLAFAVSVILMFFALSILPSPTYSDFESYPVQKKPGPLTIKEGAEMGILDKEHESLVSQIRKDLKLHPDLSIEIFIGPYQNITGEGIIIPLINPPGVVVFLDKDFYQTLTAEEKIALIAHELGHLTNEKMLLSYPSTITRFQVEADTYSTKYADPEAMISILNKMITRRGGTKSMEYEIRVQNLEKISQSKQGSH